MKKFFYYILFIFPLTVVAQSETKKNKNISFSIGTGINLTNSKAGSYFISEPAFYNYYKSSPRLGFSIKTTVDIPIAEQLSLRPMLEFIQYNQQQEYSTSTTLDEPGSSNNHDKITVNSLALSPLLNYNFKFFSLVGGPKIEYTVSAKTKNLHRAVSPYTGPQDDQRTFNFKKAKTVNNPVIGLKVGVEKKVGKSFKAGLNYQLSFTNVADYYFARRITKLRGLEFCMIILLKPKL